MKHGKRFLWIVPLFCLLAACGGQGTQAESARWDTFHHEGDNVQLSLGMTQAEVEDKLTPAEGSSPSTDTDTVIYGDTPEDRIAVTYYDGVVNNISLDETLQTEKTSNWSLQGGITVGSSKEDLDKVYGACTMSNEQDQYFVYYYDSSHTLLTEDHIDDVDYMVSFILEEDGLLACAIGSAEPALEPSSRRTMDWLARRLRSLVISRRKSSSLSSNFSVSKVRSAFRVALMTQVSSTLYFPKRVGAH